MMQSSHARKSILVFACAAIVGSGAALATGSGHDDGGSFWGGSSCEITKVLSVTPTAANLGNYTPPNLQAAVPVNITVSFKTSGSGTCKGAITFYRPTQPAVMSRVGGSGSRSYTIQSASSGGTPLIFSSWPPANRTLDFTVSGGSGTRTMTFTVYIAPQTGWLTAGNYSDSILFKVLDRKNNGYEIVEYRNFTVQSTVQQSCNLPQPSISSLDFSSAISNGLPNTTTLTVNFSGVSCSAPARIRLSGAALKNPAIQPVANFDNFINWQADATFGAAQATLATTSPTLVSQVTSIQQNVLSGPTQSALITLKVKLLPGKRIIAGHYSNILTVTIDPAI
jgi:hypothetical protein